MATNIVLLSARQCAVPCAIIARLSSMNLVQEDDDDDDNVSFEAQTITIHTNRYILHD